MILILNLGRRKVRQLAVALKISEATSETGERFFNLAVTNEFIRGRKSTYVVASCLYAACRMKKDSHMLIDFSDMMQVRHYSNNHENLLII